MSVGMGGEVVDVAIVGFGPVGYALQRRAVLRRDHTVKKPRK